MGKLWIMVNFFQKNWVTDIFEFKVRNRFKFRFKIWDKQALVSCGTYDWTCSLVKFCWVANDNFQHQNWHCFNRYEFNIKTLQTRWYRHTDVNIKHQITQSKTSNFVIYLSVYLRHWDDYVGKSCITSHNILGNSHHSDKNPWLAI